MSFTERVLAISVSKSSIPHHPVIVRNASSFFSWSAKFNFLAHLTHCNSIVRLLTGALSEFVFTLKVMLPIGIAPKVTLVYRIAANFACSTRHITSHKCACDVSTRSVNQFIGSSILKAGFPIFPQLHEVSLVAV